MRILVYYEIQFNHGLMMCIHDKLLFHLYENKASCGGAHV